jgi:hypothetical protein
MKVLNENGVLTVVSSVPKNKTINGSTVVGFNRLSDEELEAYGYFNINTPIYDSRVEELSAIKLVGNVYTYNVIDRFIAQTLAELKTQKISNLKSIIGSQLQKTDCFVIRQMDSGEVAPQEVIDSRAELRTQSNTIWAEIKALTTKKAVLTYDLPTFNI